jgi:L-Ala-D/L-Glu epimerase
VRLTHRTISLHPRHPFVIARGGYASHVNVVVSLSDDSGLVGWGEGAPNRYYGESAETAVAALNALSEILERSDGWSIEAIEAEIDRAVPGNAAAKSAVSSALHDLLGKRLGAPLYRVLGLEPSRSPLSSFTIGIAPTDELRRRVAEAAEYPILKVKLGTDRDHEIVATVRDAAPEKRLRVDANAAWTREYAVNMAAFLAEHGVEILEQPVAAADMDGLRYVKERSSIPIIADETCMRAADIPVLAGSVHGINIKLAKCGSLREAVRMVHVARAHGLIVMAGCMIESSLGISAVAQIASLLDFADLDGAALLVDDPWEGATIEGGQIRLPDRSGLGAIPIGER